MRGNQPPDHGPGQAVSRGAVARAAWSMLGLAAAGLAMTVGIMVALPYAAPQATAHDHQAAVAAEQGDSKRADWFKSLVQPGTKDASCCNLDDCHETEAEWRGSTEDGQWWAIIEEKWTAVPQSVVLRNPLSIDGAAYVCNYPSSQGGQRICSLYGGGGCTVTEATGPRILCFVPPIPGS